MNDKEPMECPGCGNTNISAGPIDGETLSRQVVCGDCDYTWIELFKFVEWIEEAS